MLHLKAVFMLKWILNKQSLLWGFIKAEDLLTIYATISFSMTASCI